MHGSHDTCESLSDAEVVAQTLSDRQAYACIMHRYQEKIKRYVRRITSVSPEELDDIVQEIFINAYVNLNSFNPQLKFSSWLYRIAHNHTISTFRKRQARPQTISSEANDSIINSVAADFHITEELDRQYLREHIEEILGKMDLKYRDVLVLRFMEEKSYEELSDILRKPPGTIATLLNRAKKQFKKLMTPT